CNFETEAVRGAIQRCQEEVVIPRPIYRAGTLVLCHRPRDYQPLITCAVKVKVGDLVIELGFSGGDGRAFLVLRNKAKAGFTGQTWVPSIGPSRRVDPTT